MVAQRALALALLATLATPNTACVASNGSDLFEFIVVGSGAGGGPLAARLARAGHSVLLLEAGEDVGNAEIYKVPAYHALSTEHQALAWWYFVSHHEDEAIDRADSKYTEQGILYPRGSALGGSTAVNAMVTVLPPPADWDRLAMLTGDASFRAARMASMFDRVREWLPIEQADPGLAASDRAVTDMLLGAAAALADEDELSTATDPDELTGTVTEMANLVAGDLNERLLRGETTGLFRLPTATEDGERRGTRELLVDTVAAGHPLTIKTGAFVTRVIWEEASAGGPPVAAGVEYVEGNRVYEASLGQRGTPSEPHVMRASREVILSAGVFNTPQLLMLSGVGDPEHLAAMGIDTVVDLPAVGTNLQDRYEAAVISELDQPSTLLEDCRLGVTAAEDPCLKDWREGDGVYRTNGFLASALTRSSEDVPLADLQIFASPSEGRGYFPGYSTAAIEQKDRFTWLLLKAHTTNNDGRVRLKSSDPFSSVDIRFNSFDEEDPLHDPDLLAMVEGVKRVRAFAARARARNPDEDLREVWPGADVASDEEIASFVRREAWGHHACCTAPMGSDTSAWAVLDSGFRVRGTQRLRVVDASVFPEIPGTFIALPIFMISEAAAAKILEDHADQGALAALADLASGDTQ